MRRHRFDAVPLLGGLLFLGISVVYANAGFSGDAVSAGVLLPVILIGLGVIGLVRVVFRTRRRDL